MRRRIFTTPPAEFWQLIEAAGQMPSSTDDEVNALYVLMSSLSPWTWRGRLACWCYVAFIGVLDGLLFFVPLPIRILSKKDRVVVWRIRWLWWMFLWGLELEAKP